MDLLSTMKMVELFRGLNEDQLTQLSGIAQKEEYSTGQTIVVQGEPGDKMYIIGKGQVEVKITDSSGDSFSAVYLGNGQVFGEMALVDDGTRSASILAAGNGATVYGIPNRDFTDLCQNNTAIGYVMMRNIAQDLSFKLRHRDAGPSSNQ